MINTKKTQVDAFQIGGGTSNAITAKYFVGTDANGWVDALPEKESDALESVMHICNVTMPYLHVGTHQEARVWRRDEILAHYGMAVGYEEKEKK